MNVAQIENNLQLLIKSFDEQSFIYDLLLAYGQPKASIKRLKDGGLNLSKNSGEILWKKKLFFKESKASDLHDLIDDLRIDDAITKHSPRFIIVTDYINLVARDSKTNDTLDIEILELPRHFDFFLPLAGMEKAQHQFENPADVKAAERMGKLYDEIKKDNPTDTEEEVHNLNVFLTRLLFCFFAEDTNIFEKSQFTHSLVNHTQDDGSDLHSHFERLFEVMNTPENERGNIPVFLNSFPYVNGGLFRNQHNIPQFSRKSRQVIIESGELDWSAINPDIFGSMIQAVITPEHRGGLGMHYTSVPNIMKVIEPLFLNDLNEDFEKSKYDSKKLYNLLERLGKIKIFDPACGSGNFLIIAYKELRQLEIKILNQLKEFQFFSRVELSNFYGIEIDDFAHEVAILSLWLAQHQMNIKFKEIFGDGNPTLPLRNGGNIIHGNATRLNWQDVCPKNEGDEIYILGNPPYLGSSLQSRVQKEDMTFVFSKFQNYKNLDYISCWFIKGANYIKGINSRLALVSTNSICQGEQVSLLWPTLLSDDLEIYFAYNSFKWVNNAKDNAGVSVIIVGLRNKSKKDKIIFKDDIKKYVSNINAYLSEGKNIFIGRRSIPFNNYPELVRGSMPTDGGNFTLTIKEKELLETSYPESKKFIKKYLSGGDFLNDIERWCLWIEDNDIDEAVRIKFINDRLEKIKEFRLKSDAPSTVEYSIYPNRFRQIAYKESSCIVIPLTSSENREYIPIKFLEAGTVVTNSAGVIYDAPIYLFAILTSKIHNIWIKNVCGSLESRIRYSAVLGYNNFPMFLVDDKQKSNLENCVYRVLEEREKHSEKTLAQLYDPKLMPKALRDAHIHLDLIVESFYRSKPFESDEDRLAHLFNLYEQMVEESKSKGTLFDIESKPKKKKK